MLCGTCLEKSKINEVENVDTIWGFNPFLYNSFYEMRESFSFFCSENYKGCDFYTCFNEDGYNFSQWYIYYLGCNTYKCKNLHRQTMWMFDVMSAYPFFNDMIRLGKRDDPLHTSLHHFLKYVNRIGYLQDKVMKLLISHGLKMEDEDHEGNSGYDYMNDKILSEDDKKDCSFLTRRYKTMESEIEPLILEKIGDLIKKCELCNDFLEKYNDMLANKEKLLENEDLINSIKIIIKDRQDCINIYKKYDKCLKSCERHQYVVDIYQSIID